MQRFFDASRRLPVLLPGSRLAYGLQGPGYSSLFEIK